MAMILKEEIKGIFLRKSQNVPLWKIKSCYERSFFFFFFMGRDLIPLKKGLILIDLFRVALVL